MQSQINKLYLFVSGFLLWVSLYSFWAYYTPYLSNVGLSNAAVGIIAGSFGMVSLILKLPLGILSDRLKKYKVVATIGLGFMIISDIIMLSSTAPAMLLLARIMNGITSSTWLVYYTMSAVGGATNNVSKMQSIQFLGEFGGFILSGFVYERFGMRGTFIMSVCCASVAFVLSFFINDSGVSKEPIRLSELGMIVRDKNMLICAGLSIIYQFCIFATAYNFTQNYVTQIGGTGMQLSYVSALRLLFSSISCRLIDIRFFKKRSDVFNLMIGFGSLAIYCFGIPQCTSVFQIYALSIVGGLSSGFGLSYLTAKCLDNTPENGRTAGMGFYQCVFAVGVSFGPTVMGVLLEKTESYATSFGIMGIVALIGAGLVVLLIPNRIKQKHQQCKRGVIQ